MSQVALYIRMTHFEQLHVEHHLLSSKMRFLLLVVVVALTVTDVSGGRWWRKVKQGARNVWQQHKGSIIKTGVGVLLGGRSIDAVDQNGDGVLTRSELQQHMDERDVDDLLDMLDENGEEQVRREVLESYIQEALVNEGQ